MAELHDLLVFLDASPSPSHAVASAASRLTAAGFTRVEEDADWFGVTQGFVVRGSSLVAFALPNTPAPTAGEGFRIVGAHTDSPGLRIKPRPDTGAAGWKQLAVEIYGGVLLNSWLDRDLGVAGRLLLADGTDLLVDVRRPLARVPQLAIHLDRDVNDRGLVLDKQQHLSPVWGVGATHDGEFTSFLADQTGLADDDIAAWELCLYDLTPASLLGDEQTLLASGRLDNQVSCWAAIDALCSGTTGGHTNVVALFDHEEVGSESDTGAAGPLLERVLERLVLATGGDRERYLRLLARSTCVSADNAHAVHPNYPERHEPGHRPMVNAGPAIKINSNQRYATSPDTAVMFEQACSSAGVPHQVFVSRNNVPCGSTIGPITATRLGISTVDVGVPQLSMHSARELCGAHDPLHLTAALATYFVY